MVFRHPLHCPDFPSFLDASEATHAVAGVTGRLGTLFYTLQVAAFPSMSAMDGLIRERHAATREMLRLSYTPGGYMLTKVCAQ